MLAPTDDSLFEVLALIKLATENIRQSIIQVPDDALFLEKDRLYLYEIKHLLSICIVNNPVKSSLKNFKPHNKYIEEMKKISAASRQIADYKLKFPTNNK